MELRDRFTDMREMDLQVQSKFDVVLYIFCMSKILCLTLSLLTVAYRFYSV